MQMPRCKACLDFIIGFIIIRHFLYASSVLSTFGRLLSLLPTIDFMYMPFPLLNYGLLDIGKCIIWDELKLVFYHPGAPSLGEETDIYISYWDTWCTLIVR